MQSAEKGMLLWRGAAAYKLYRTEMPTAEYRNSGKNETSNNNLGTKMKQKTNKMLIFTSLATYFIFHPWNQCFYPGAVQTRFCSCLGCKPLADGTLDVSMVVSVIAALGLGRLISLPFSSPLYLTNTEKKQAELSVCSVMAYFFGMANSHP